MIAIPNMDKPKSCYNHCLEGFIANEEIGCPLKDYIESHQYKNAIHPDCPLIEIVHCKDCKYGILEDDDSIYRCGYNGSDWNEGNHFCTYGERRE